MDKILFCNVAYMEHYDAGKWPGDVPRHGGAYVDENGDAHEKNNFAVCSDGLVRGFVETGYYLGAARELHVEKFGDYDESVSGVTVVFSAFSDDMGCSVVVGFYRNATVYRERQKYRGRYFNLSADKSDCFLIPHELRRIEVPRFRKNGFGFGQSNVWFAEDSNYVDCVRAAIEKFSQGEGCASVSLADVEAVSSVESSGLVGEDLLAVAKVRVGQSDFRKMLFERYPSGCALGCGVCTPSLLVASHIKPWSASSVFEKVDADNGFLFCPNHDKLFDMGFISFSSSGRIMVSPLLGDASAFGITGSESVVLTPGNAKYLEYHREKVFREA